MDKTKMAVAVFDKLANKYQDKFMDVSLYHDTLDVFCNLIAKEYPDVLEIACGPGNITKYLLEKRPDLKILGTDLAPNMLELATTNNPNAEFQLMDCRDVSSLKKRYDAVMCGFCLPYLSKEEVGKLIADTSNLLNTGGVLYISTMEGDGTMRLEISSSGDQMYIYYHEGHYLVSVLKGNGFVIMDLQRKRYLAADGTPVTDLVIIAQK